MARRAECGTQASVRVGFWCARGGVQVRGWSALVTKKPGLGWACWPRGAQAATKEVALDARR